MNARRLAVLLFSNKPFDKNVYYERRLSNIYGINLVNDQSQGTLVIPGEAQTGFALNESFNNFRYDNPE